MNRIYVTGHRNPDTDSIAAAISYAALRNALGNRDYVPLILNMVWVYVVLKLTDRIERFLGKGGIYVIRKFFGIILLAISARLFTANLTLLIEQFQKAQ